jgi:hypothetical protein
MWHYPASRYRLVCSVFRSPWGNHHVGTRQGWPQQNCLRAPNDDPFRANKESQKPLFKFESHVTHNFNPAFWASIDSVYSYGGATKTDGQSDDNRQRSFNMGATLGFQFSAEFGLKLTYGKTIDHNDDGWDGDFARLALTYNQL